MFSLLLNIQTFWIFFGHMHCQPAPFSAFARKSLLSRCCQCQHVSILSTAWTYSWIPWTHFWYPLFYQPITVLHSANKKDCPAILASDWLRDYKLKAMCLYVDLVDNGCLIADPADNLTQLPESSLRQNSNRDIDWLRLDGEFQISSNKFYSFLVKISIVDLHNPIYLLAIPDMDLIICTPPCSCQIVYFSNSIEI